MAAGLTAFDEHGLRWYIAEGDPAWEASIALTRLGYRQIVLPRRVLEGGPVDLCLPERIVESLTSVYETLELGGYPIEKMTEIRDALLRALTLWDCCSTLGEAIGEGKEDRRPA